MADGFPVSIDELKETFDLLEDWEERYEYIIELGRKVPAMPGESQCEENRVHGCMSTVWLVSEVDMDSGNMLVQADSDSLIVKGLIAILVSAFHEKSPQDILRFDTDELFAEFGLNQHLSANRRNGLFSMVKRIKELATSYLSQSE